MTSRQFVLDRIRAALDVRPEQAREDQRTKEWAAIERRYRLRGTLDETERFALFAERLRHYNAELHQSTGDVAHDIREILFARGKRILIVPPAFPAAWLPSGFMLIPDDNLSYEQLSSSDGVVTACTLAIAVTGTLVLQSAPAEGRRATTLIPDYHLCVLRGQDLVELVPEAILKLQNSKREPLTFISGPSATVDIEMTRVRGVHGPRTLDVLVV